MGTQVATVALAASLDPARHQDPCAMAPGDQDACSGVAFGGP